MMRSRFLFLLTGFLFLIGSSAFQLAGANNNNRAAAPLFATKRILGNIKEFNIRHFSPSTLQPSSKLYSSLPDDAQASLSLEEVPPNIAWFHERFNFSEKVLNRISDNRRDLLTLDQSVLDERTNWLLKRLKLSDKELGSIIRRFPSILACRPDTNLGPTLDYLQERLALNAKALSRIIQKHPQVLVRSVTQALEPKLNWAETRLHLNETKALQKFISTNPKILTSSIEEKLERNFMFLQERLNLTVSQTAKLCVRAPSVLNFSVDDNLVPTLNWLEQRLDLNRIQLGKMIRTAPGILNFRVESLEQKLHWLQQRLCLDDASLKKIVVRIPTIMGLSSSANLEPTAQWIQERLFLAESDDVGKLVRKFPPLLNMSIETNLQPTLDFFKKCIGDEAAVGLVLKNPVVMGASLDKRLKPRLEDVRQIGIEIDTGCLQRMAQQTEERWYKSLDYQSDKLAKSKAEESLW